MDRQMDGQTDTDQQSSELAGSSQPNNRIWWAVPALAKASYCTEIYRHEYHTCIYNELTLQVSYVNYI